jgi:hypothetical protein
VAFDNPPMKLRRLVAFGLGLLAACSPTFNWREAKLPVGPGQAMFPCRPSQEQRKVPLAGRTVTLTILACRTGDTMFALGMVDVGELAQVGAALEALKSAAAANLGGMPVPIEMPAVEGAAHNQPSRGSLPVAGQAARRPGSTGSRGRVQPGHTGVPGHGIR